MSEIISQLTQALASFLGDIYVAVGLVSLLPMVEARGAIPMGLALGMPTAAAYIFCCCTSFLVSPVLFFAFKPLVEKLKTTTLFKRVGHALADSFQTKADKITYADTEKAQTKTRLKKLIGLYAFVALPIPMTGVWSGSIVASFLEEKWYYILPTIFLGNLTAGGIIALLSALLGENSYIIVLILVAFILIAIVSMIITVVKKLRKQDNQEITYTDTKDDNDNK